MANTPPRSAGRIPDSEWDAATARAKEKGETITDVIRRALRRYAATAPRAATESRPLRSKEGKK